MKSLERQRDEFSEKIYQQSIFSVDKEWLRTCSERSFDAGVKAALSSEAVQGLYVALDAMIKSARDKNCGLRIADEALAKYKAAFGQGE